jgi:hypothetical protein
MSASEEAADSFAHLRHLKTAPHLCCQSSVEISQTETETGVAVGADIWLGDAPWWHSATCDGINRLSDDICRNSDPTYGKDLQAIDGLS